MRIVKIICVVSLILSCSDADYILSEKKIVRVIIDMHIADAIQTDRNMKVLIDDFKSIDFYKSVFEKHNITKEQFDSSIHYYTKRPEEYQRIYEKVFSEMSKMESDLNDSPEDFRSRKTKIIWNSSFNHISVSDTVINTGEFSVPVEKPGVYSIEAGMLIYKNDESINPRFQAYFWYDDGTEEGYRDYFPEVPVIKAPIMREYSVTKELHDQKVTHIKGNIIKRDNTDSIFIKNFKLLNVKVGYRESK